MAPPVYATVSTNNLGPPQRITGKYANIFLGFLILTLPLAALVAALLVLIYHYRVEQITPSGFSVASVTPQDEHGALYVDINPTILMKVASLSSTIAGFLTTVAAGLAAYPLASAVLVKTRAENPDALLSPFHYYLALDLIENAGYFTVWRWLKFRFSKSQKQTNPPPQLISLGRIACVTLVFGALIFVGDTWLHFTTDPTEFTQFGSLGSDAAAYSMILNSNCTSQDNTYNEQNDRPCSFSPSIRGGYFLNPITTLEVFNNISTTRSVNVVSVADVTHAFLGIPNNGQDQGHDFTATTFSVSTQCQSATAACDVSRDNITSGAGSVFHCAKYTAWWGLVNGPRTDFSKHYFTDASGTQNASSLEDTISNPFYVGFGGFTDPSSAAALELIQRNDPGVIAQEFGGVGYLFFCNTTVYDVSYTAVNGSVTAFTATPSNSSVSTALMAAESNLDSGDLQLRDAADLGALLANDTQDMANTFALAYSRVLMSTVSGALQTSPILNGRQRITKIVARVPVTPLYFLVASVALMIGLGVYLTITALVTTRIKDIEEVRARLSMKQLVADRMEPEAARIPIKSIDDIFTVGAPAGLTKRIGIGKRNSSVGGWEFKVWDPLK
ncbi:hypothetical protein PEBR_37778 [Penicillium brasilianum]|uniref:Uncharacterized protein n=1 Tax=Penicillium brasilianum TaxID=104259 RepID=A0A1S9RB07_PENBI|nr:hypothetical protein PEBR_37778 [Penicillium brasilianum]